MVDEQGNVKEYYDYYPFGKTLRSSITDEAVATYKFTGKELDDENDLEWYYFGARYYDAGIGRFLSVDRFADKYPSLTPYHYTANNPMIFVDINGDSLELVGNEEQRQLALDAIRKGLPPEVRNAIQVMEVNGKYFINDKLLNEVKRISNSQDFLSLKQIANSPGMAQLIMAKENLQFQYFDKSLGQSVTTSFNALGEAFQGITFTTDIANTIYDRTSIVSNVPGVNQAFVRSSMSMENIVQITAHELYGHIHPHLMGKRASHYQVGDSFDQRIIQIMNRALMNYRRK